MADDEMLDSITMNPSKLWEIVKKNRGPDVLQFRGSQRMGHDRD